MSIDTKNPILIDIPMPIVTPRLIIRPVMPGDGVETHSSVAETWDDLNQWMLWATVLETADEVETKIRSSHAKFLLREDFRMVAIDRESGKLAVFTGLHRFDWTIRRFEIGYWCRKEFQGRGLVTESTNALARYAFSALQARAVCICHVEGNEDSRRVIQRLKFHFEGQARFDGITPDGVVRDKLWYSHTRIDDLPPLDVEWGREP